MNIEFSKNSIKKYNKIYPEIEKKIKSDSGFEKKVTTKISYVS